MNPSNKMRGKPQYATFLLLCIAFSLCSCRSGTNEKTENGNDAASANDSLNLSGVADGKILYNTCIPCHGAQAEGKIEMNAPSLVNQETWYLESQMMSFKKGFRGADTNDSYGMQMAAIANTLADAKAINAVAQYIKTLPPAVTQKTFDGDIASGQSHYHMICGACHGPGAQGNKDLNAPKLTGIDDWYLERQLTNYIKGVRGSHPDDVLGAQMQSMAKTLKDEQAVKDVAAYIQSLQEKAL